MTTLPLEVFDADLAVMVSRSAAVDADNAMLRTAAPVGSSNVTVVWAMSEFTGLWIAGGTDDCPDTAPVPIVTAMQTM